LNPSGAIAGWAKQAERDSGEWTDGPNSAEKEELAQLRQERDILAKAAAWCELPPNFAPVFNGC